MPVTIPQVKASRPEALTEAAGELGQKASGLASQMDTQRATITGLRTQWHGTASDAAVAKAEPTLARMQQIHDALTRAQPVLRDGGGRLGQTRAGLIGAVDQLQGQGWQVSPDGTVSVKPGGPLDQFARTSPVAAIQILQLAAANSVDLKIRLAEFDTTDRELDQNLRSAVAGLDGAPRKSGVSCAAAGTILTTSAVKTTRKTDLANIIVSSPAHAGGQWRQAPRAPSLPAIRAGAKHARWQA